MEEEYKKPSTLTKPWRDFAEAWITFLKESTDKNEENLISVWIDFNGKKVTKEEQQDWVTEKRKFLKEIKEGSKSSWQEVHNLFKHSYKDYEYPDKILKIAESKSIGKYVWTL